MRVGSLFLCRQDRDQDARRQAQRLGTFAITKTTGGGGRFSVSSRVINPGRAVGRSARWASTSTAKTAARLAIRLITGKNQSCGTFVTSYLPGKYRPTPLCNDGTRYTEAGLRSRWRERPRAVYVHHSRRCGSKPEEFEKANLPENFMAEVRKRFPITTTFTVDLPEGFKKQGTTFDHFGLLNGMKPGGHITIHFDDLQYVGCAAGFSDTRKWDVEYLRQRLNPLCRAELRLQRDQPRRRRQSRRTRRNLLCGTESPIAWYADKVGPLSLDQKLIVRGKIAFLSGSPDSGMVFGWFNSKTTGDKDGLKDFVGVRVEGPYAASAITLRRLSRRAKASSGSLKRPRFFRPTENRATGRSI